MHTWHITHSSITCALPLLSVSLCLFLCVFISFSVSVSFSVYVCISLLSPLSHFTLKVICICLMIVMLVSCQSIFVRVFIYSTLSVGCYQFDVVCASAWWLSVSVSVCLSVCLSVCVGMCLYLLIFHCVFCLQSSYIGIPVYSTLVCLTVHCCLCPLGRVLGGVQSMWYWVVALWVYVSVL